MNPTLNVESGEELSELIKELLASVLGDSISLLSSPSFKRVVSVVLFGSFTDQF